MLFEIITDVLQKQHARMCGQVHLSEGNKSNRKRPACSKHIWFWHIPFSVKHIAKGFKVCHTNIKKNTNTSWLKSISVSPRKHPGTLSIRLSLRNPDWLYLGADCVLPIDRKAQLCYFYPHPGNFNVHYEDKNLSSERWGGVCMFATFVRRAVSQDGRAKKTAENKKEKDSGVGCWGLPSQTGTKLVDGPSCRTPRSNALWAAVRFGGTIQASLTGSPYLITCDGAAPRMGIQPLRNERKLTKLFTVHTHLQAGRTVATLCALKRTSVSLSTSTDGGLSNKEKSRPPSSPD